MGKFAKEEDRGVQLTPGAVVTAQPTAFMTMYCDRRGSFPVYGSIEVTGCTRERASSQGMELFINSNVVKFGEEMDHVANKIKAVCTFM